MNKIIRVTEQVREALETELFRCFQNAFDYRDGTQMGDYVRSWKYYHGILPLPASNKTSTFVDRTVMSSVNGVLQEMLTVFTSGDAVKIVAQDNRTAYQAKIATDVVNHIFLNQNDGYNLLSGAIKEALVGRNAFIKCWWNEEKLTHNEEAENLQNMDELNAYLEGLAAAGAEEIDADIKPNSDGSFNVAVKYTMVNRRVKVMHVPFEEVIFEQQARDLNDCKYFCHMSRMTKATLLDLGYPEDELDAVTFTNNDATTQRSTMWSAAFARTGGHMDMYQDNGQDADNAAARAMINEHYQWTDALNSAGDKSPHLYMIHEVNGKIFRVEEITEIPFISLTAIPLPATIYGESISDYTMDIQDQKTARNRAMIDNIMNAAYGRYTAIAGSYDRRSLLNNVPGGVVEMDRPDSVNLLPYHSLPNGIDFYSQELDQDLEMRTGVSRVSQALEKEMMRGGQGADALGIILTASQSRQRMYARNLAHGGISQLYKRIYSLFFNNSKDPLPVLTAQGTIPVMPNQLPPVTGVEVNVLLNPQEKTQEIAKFSSFLSQLMQLQQMGFSVQQFVTEPQVHYLITELVSAYGWKNTQDFVTPIEAVQPQQPDPLKMAQAQQAQAQAAAAQAQAKFAEAQANKLLVDADISVKTLEFEQQKAADEMALANARLNFEQEKAADAQNLAEANFHLQTDVERSKATHQDQQNINKATQIQNDAVVKQAQVYLKGHELRQRSREEATTVAE